MPNIRSQSSTGPYRGLLDLPLIFIAGARARIPVKSKDKVTERESFFQEIMLLKGHLSFI